MPNQEQVLSNAIFKQWQDSKARREPGAILKQAQQKGLTAIHSECAGIILFTIIGNGKVVFRGNAESAAVFVENYSVLLKI